MKKMITSTAMVLFIMVVAHAQKSEVYIANGRAIKGYDPVAFFTDSKPMIGQDSLMYSWMGASWLFTSRKNLDAFKAHPEKYAPQYGGYCAYGTAMGHKAPTEAETWSIVDDKLYFNYDQKVKTMWLKDRSAMIRKANQQWPALKDKE